MKGHGVWLSKYNNHGSQLWTIYEVYIYLELQIYINNTSLSVE